MDLTVGMRVRHTVTIIYEELAITRTGVIVADDREHSDTVSRVHYTDGHWMGEYGWVHNDDPTLVVLS